MLRVLHPNNGKDTILIDTSHIFVSVTDFGLIAMLREIIVSPGQHHWEWISLTNDRPIDVSRIGNKYSSFNNAINRAINDPYRTVYEFVSLEDIHWDYIEFIDNIKTVYKAEE